LSFSVTPILMNILFFLRLTLLPSNIRVDSRRCVLIYRHLYIMLRRRDAGVPGPHTALWMIVPCSILVYVSPLLLSPLNPTSFAYNYHLCLRGTLFEWRSQWTTIILISNFFLSKHRERCKILFSVHLKRSACTEKIAV